MNDLSIEIKRVDSYYYSRQMTIVITQNVHSQLEIC